VTAKDSKGISLSEIMSEMKIDYKILDRTSLPPNNFNNSVVNNNFSEFYNNPLSIGNAMEIKNNNFEINNNFYGSINLENSSNLNYLTNRF
jgi:hypothetical protein